MRKLLSSCGRQLSGPSGKTPAATQLDAGEDRAVLRVALLDAEAAMLGAPSMLDPTPRETAEEKLSSLGTLML